MLIYTKGLPGSGKSTWAREFQKENPGVVLISRDDVRLMLYPGETYRYTGPTEDLVTIVWRASVEAALAQGFTVVVHDTNFDPRAISALTELAEFWEVELQCKDFTHVTAEECISRDSMRRGRSHVGEEVINRMATKWMVTPEKDQDSIQSNSNGKGNNDRQDHHGRGGDPPGGTSLAVASYPGATGHASSLRGSA